MADAILIPFVGDDIGLMLQKFDQAMRVLHQRFPCDFWVFEAPILTGRDKLEVVRKLYSIAGHLEWLGMELGVAVEEAGVQKLKRELAGFSKATKLDMVTAAERAGIKLPETKEAGREDAADAFGAWLAGLRAHGRRDIIAKWDQRLYGPRMSGLL